MPGTRVRRAASCIVTVCESSCTLMPDSTASAMRAPMPEILSNSRKVERSSVVPKP